MSVSNRLRRATQAALQLGSRSSRRLKHLKASQPARSIERLEPRTMLAAGPLVTEFMAVNRSTLADGNGDFSDWIEIHNPTAAPISLGGWYLTDDVDDLTQWPLPAVEMAAGDYLVVFASGQLVDDFVDSKGFFHTNFKLDGDGNGESVLLVEPDGRTFDNTFLDYPSQDADISYGIRSTVSARRW